MSTRLSLLHCQFCDQIIYCYQELLNHVESHQVHQQKEIHTVEGSNTHSLPLSNPSKSPPPPLLYHPHWVKDNGCDTNVYGNQQVPLSLSPPPSSSDRMSTHLALVHCPLCDGSVYGYQEFMKHVLSHPIDYETEIDVVEGSNNLSVPLSKPSESAQHVSTMRNKRYNSQLPPLPLLVHPRWVRGNDNDTNVYVNQKLPLPLSVPSSSYDARLIRGNDDDRSVHTNLQLPPPQLSYRANLIRGNDNSKGVHTNQQLQPSPSSYRPLSPR